MSERWVRDEANLPFEALVVWMDEIDRIEYETLVDMVAQVSDGGSIHTRIVKQLSSMAFAGAAVGQ